MGEVPEGGKWDLTSWRQGVGTHGWLKASVTFSFQKGRPRLFKAASQTKRAGLLQFVTAKLGSRG